MKPVTCFLSCVTTVALMTPMAPAEAKPPPVSDQGRHWLRAIPPTPELKVPDSQEQWDRQRQEIRDQLWKLLGKLPPRPKQVQVKTLSRDDRGDYVLEKFQFDNGAGATVPGYLLLPKQPAGQQGQAQKKYPAILYCHWHGGQYDIGKEELFGTNATPVPAGAALAKAGFVVIAVDAYCFGERNGAGPGGPEEKGGAGEMTASKFNLWAGRSLWGMMLRDDLIALDYLCTRPEVDQGRIGVTGISMGATRTWWLMALDDRLKAGVAVACLTRYQDLIATEGLKYHGIYYFVPGMLEHFDTEAVVALSAPRPLLVMNGDEDWGSPVNGIHKIESAVGKVYALYGDAGKDQFRSIVYPKLGHVYTPEMWDNTMKWLTKHLGPEAGED